MSGMRLGGSRWGYEYFVCLFVGKSCGICGLKRNGVSSNVVLASISRR